MVLAECETAVRVGRVEAYRRRLCTSTDCWTFSLPPTCRQDASETASSIACVAPLPEDGRKE